MSQGPSRSVRGYLMAGPEETGSWAHIKSEVMVMVMSVSVPRRYIVSSSLKDLRRLDLAQNSSGRFH